MPLIQVKMIEEVFTQEQKKEMIAKLTDAMVSIEGKTYARSPGWSLRTCAAANGESAARP